MQFAVSVAGTVCPFLLS